MRGCLHAGWADYLGCYADTNATARRLPVLANNETFTRSKWTGGLTAGNESLDSCFSAALVGGYRLFGSMEGGECWLGNDTTWATALGPSSSCSYACLGNVTQICGGPSTLSLYAVRGARCVVPPYCTTPACKTTRLCSRLLHVYRCKRRPVAL